MDALERDYPLEASVADLIDNSIDAGARHVLIRFVRAGDPLISLCVADDGSGIAPRDFSRAMQFAARRKYGKKDLGMFGVGLKTASLSQADSLIVASRRAGKAAMGRRWTKAGIKRNDWTLDILSQDSSAAILDHRWGGLGPISSGTVIRWDRVYDFDRLQSGVDEYLDDVKTKLRKHLGLKLHRFLERRRIRIEIDVEDIETGSVGPPTAVSGLRPFPALGLSGAAGYPKVLTAALPDSGNLRMKAHIWRKRSKDEGYKLGDGRVAEHQGFYFFRHDRLIQDGGWLGILGTNEPHKSLARVEVDIPDSAANYIRVRSNKAGVDVPATFGAAISKAKARDGTSFAAYLEKAEEVYRKQAQQKSKPIVAPGPGVPADVRRALERHNVQFIRGQQCTIRWAKLPTSHFLQVDHENRCISLNVRYRNELLGGNPASGTDLPLLRVLLYLLLQDLLAGKRLGPVERMRLEAIRAATDVAVRLHARWLKE